jgi:hypothetical protein
VIIEFGQQEMHGLMIVEHLKPDESRGPLIGPRRRTLLGR